jgi:hypothetical protein
LHISTNSAGVLGKKSTNGRGVGSSTNVAMITGSSTNVAMITGSGRRETRDVMKLQRDESMGVAVCSE